MQSTSLAKPDARRADDGPPHAGEQDGALAGSWRVLPFEGAFELAYCDEAGNPTLRRVIARELKIGPGKTLLGGIDMADDGYRGFRADRIQRIIDGETGEAIDRNVLDWLIRRAERQAKAERRASLALARKAPVQKRARPNHGRGGQKNPL